MATTKDHAKIGRQEWHVEIVRHGRYTDDLDADIEHETMNRRIFRSRAAAVKFLNEKLPALDRSTTWDVTGEITTGTWESFDFADDVYGRVQDAMFEEAETPRAYAQMNGAAVEIEWEN